MQKIIIKHTVIKKTIVIQEQNKTGKFNCPFRERLRCF